MVSIIRISIFLISLILCSCARNKKLSHSSDIQIKVKILNPDSTITDEVETIESSLNQFRKEVCKLNRVDVLIKSYNKDTLVCHLINHSFYFSNISNQVFAILASENYWIVLDQDLYKMWIDNSSITDTTFILSSSNTECVIDYGTSSLIYIPL